MEILILAAIAVATLPAMLFQAISSATVRWILFGVFVAGALGTLMAVPLMENGRVVLGETVISQVHIVPIGIGSLLTLNFIVIPFVYWIDKVHKNSNINGRGKGKPVSRVPEPALHTLTALGGGIGAFASQQVFHHKRTKGNFQMIFFITILTSFAIYYALWLAVEPDMAKVDAWLESIQIFEGIRLFNGG